MYLGRTLYLATPLQLNYKEDDALYRKQNLIFIKNVSSTLNNPFSEVKHSLNFLLKTLRIQNNRSPKENQKHSRFLNNYPHRQQSVNETLEFSHSMTFPKSPMKIVFYLITKKFVVTRKVLARDRIPNVSFSHLHL